MIYKELDPTEGGDKFAVAGHRAEAQMAFYLKRFFAESAEVDVLNGLRIELGGEVAQMDHLILHPWGLLIVESKSVVESVQIEDDGQWLRWYNGRPQGMRSPITQAQMQAMLLKSLLNRAAKPPGALDAMRLDVLVAISDQGLIRWPRSGPLAEVCKADQVPDRIARKLHEARSSSAKELLHKDNRQSLARFLLKMHSPLSAAAPAVPAPPPPTNPPAPAPTPAATPAPKGQLPQKTCKHCQSGDVRLVYGQYGYYWACQSCHKNTTLGRFTCTACGGEGRIRKDKRNYYAECRSCDHSALFHTE